MLPGYGGLAGTSQASPSRCAVAGARRRRRAPKRPLEPIGGPPWNGLKTQVCRPSDSPPSQQTAPPARTAGGRGEQRRGAAASGPRGPAAAAALRGRWRQRRARGRRICGGRRRVRRVAAARRRPLAGGPRGRRGAARRRPPQRAAHAGRVLRLLVGGRGLGASPRRARAGRGRLQWECGSGCWPAPWVCCCCCCCCRLFWRGCLSWNRFKRSDLPPHARLGPKKASSPWHEAPGPAARSFAAAQSSPRAPTPRTSPLHDSSNQVRRVPRSRAR